MTGNAVKPLLFVTFTPRTNIAALAEVLHAGRDIRRLYAEVRGFYGSLGPAITIESFGRVNISHIDVESFARFYTIRSEHEHLKRLTLQDAKRLGRELVARARRKNTIPIVFLCPEGASVLAIDRLRVLNGGAS